MRKNSLINAPRIRFKIYAPNSNTASNNDKIMHSLSLTFLLLAFFLNFQIFILVFIFVLYDKHVSLHNWKNTECSD